MKKKALRNAKKEEKCDNSLNLRGLTINVSN
jgi:hypothetical protein